MDFAGLVCHLAVTLDYTGESASIRPVFDKPCIK